MYIYTRDKSILIFFSSHHPNCWTELLLIFYLNFIPSLVSSSSVFFCQASSSYWEFSFSTPTWAITHWKNTQYIYPKSYPNHPRPFSPKNLLKEKAKHSNTIPKCIYTRAILWFKTSTQKKIILFILDFRFGNSLWSFP